jgi:hypothetical protein
MAAIFKLEVSARKMRMIFGQIGAVYKRGHDTRIRQIAVYT